MRTALLSAIALSAVSLPLAGCANGGLLGGGNDRVYQPQAVNQGLADGDTVYRDSSGRYYCRRENGTTGTLVGAGVGALLGNIIAPGGSKTVGTLIGGAGGAVAGRAIDRSDLACK